MYRERILVRVCKRGELTEIGQRQERLRLPSAPVEYEVDCGWAPAPSFGRIGSEFHLQRRICQLALECDPLRRKPPFSVDLHEPVLAYVGTVVLMPFMVPWLAKGFTADPWTIAKPLLFFIAMPLVIGVAIRRVAEKFADKAAPVAKKVTGLNTLVLCAVLLWVYRSEIIGAVGAYAVATQILYYALLGLFVTLLPTWP